METDAPQNPRMTVVLAAAAGVNIAPTLGCLRAQSVCGDLEIVIVTEDSATRIEPDALRPFGSQQIVAVPRFSSKAAANAVGARAARSPWVVFAEDHGFPQPGWGDALLRQHEAGCDAVGPRMANANPGSSVSWCDLLINYGSWVEPHRGGACETLPGHHCCYKAQTLEGLGDRLEDWLDVENELHLEMGSRGATLALASDAVIAHVNISRWRSWLPALFHAGRIYAAERCRTWSAPRKLAYAAAWPAIAGARWLRLGMAWPSSVDDLPSRATLAIPLLIGFLADAAGQGLGYLLGVGSAGARLLPFEFGRVAHVRLEDRHLLEGPS